MKESPKSDEERSLTSFGEPLWVDALKTIGLGAAMLLLMLVIGSALGVMFIAPWARESFDCSMYCVIERDLREYFGDAEGK